MNNDPELPPSKNRNNALSWILAAVGVFGLSAAGDLLLHKDELLSGIAAAFGGIILITLAITLNRRDPKPKSDR